MSAAESEVLARVNSESWVYFIRCGDYVKIGVSQDVTERLLQLQAANPYPLEVIGVTPGAFAIERFLHGRFAQYAHRGEWFVAHEEILKFAASHCNPHKNAASRIAARRRQLLLIVDDLWRLHNATAESLRAMDAPDRAIAHDIIGDIQARIALADRYLAEMGHAE